MRRSGDFHRPAPLREMAPAEERQLHLRIMSRNLPLGQWLFSEAATAGVASSVSRYANTNVLVGRRSPRASRSRAASRKPRRLPQPRRLRSFHDLRRVLTGYDTDRRDSAGRFRFFLRAVGADRDAGRR
jgi:hypothetical protein